MHSWLPGTDLFVNQQHEPSFILGSCPDCPSPLCWWVAGYPRPHLSCTVISSPSREDPHGINQPWFSACSLARNHARDSCKEKILLLFDIFLRKEGGKKMFPCCRLVAPSCIKGRAGTRNISNPYVCPQGDIAVSWEPPRNGVLWHSPTCHLSWLCVSAFCNALPKL